MAFGAAEPRGAARLDGERSARARPDRERDRAAPRPARLAVLRRRVRPGRSRAAEPAAAARLGPGKARLGGVLERGRRPLRTGRKLLERQPLGPSAPREGVGDLERAERAPVLRSETLG